VLVEFMVADKWSSNTKMLHYHSRCARVLCQNKSAGIQHLNGSRRHVRQIADRSRYHEKLSTHFI